MNPTVEKPSRFRMNLQTKLLVERLLSLAPLEYISYVELKAILGLPLQSIFYANLPYLTNARNHCKSVGVYFDAVPKAGLRRRAGRAKALYSPVTKTCPIPACSFRNRAIARYCAQCGNPLCKPRAEVTALAIR